jgi:uncharacterized membrane protein YgcG
MFYIKVSVPKGRDGAAVVEFRSGSARLATGDAVASATPDLAAKHGNPGCSPMRAWGHPPLGVYMLLAQGPAPAGTEIEYGPNLLVFQPMAGKALEAEAFGRLLLPVFAGPAGRQGRLRATQGGVRLRQDQLDMLMQEIKRVTDVVLEIGEMRSHWWQFWKSAPAHKPLAPEPPRLSAPPLDEITLATQIAGGKRLAKRVLLRDDDRPDRGTSSSSSSGESTSYSGRGGEYGGAGASGSWDAPSAGARGVDSSGRIVAAAAGAALAAGAVAADGAGSAVDTQASTSY